MDGDGEEASADGQSHNEVDSDDAEETPVDPKISETREEITGLMDKIRVLSKHFRGGQA